MDPKALSSLDPKLRETYEKVMGTSTQPQTIATPIPKPFSPPSSSSTTKIPLATILPLIPAHPLQTVNSTNPASPQSSSFSLPSQPIQKPIAQPTTPDQALHPPAKNSSPLIKILYVFASIIFLAVYTVFWLKIFNFKLPFLPF